MSQFQTGSYQIAIPKTIDGNGIAEAIYPELENLGHRPVLFPLQQTVPEGTDVVFLFGPFGKFLHVPQQFSILNRSERPTFVYWNTEGMPDLRIPWRLAGIAGRLRSWLGRLSASESSLIRKLSGRPPLSSLEPRLLRFRYLGDYLYAYRKGWVDVFADISAVYTAYLRRFGLPAIFAPFGSFPGWYADLELERDIDVLWMGKRGTKRRSMALDTVREDLRAHGVQVHMVDNVENPFVFDDDRTELLNRAKITLNLLRTWYDENSLRICIAAPNRSLIVSEPLLAHVPQYQAGIHYASAPVKQLGELILFYLDHPQETCLITENAYQLTTTTLTFRRSMQTILEAVRKARQEQSIIQ